MSVVCLIVGLRNPDKFSKLLKSKANRKNVALYFGGVAAVCFVLAIITSPKPVNPSANIPAQPTNTAASVVPKTAAIFDVPSLIGKNIDQITQILGTPKDNTEPTLEQLRLGTKEWDKTYEKAGKELLVTYRTSDRTIVDFFLDNKGSSHLSETDKQTMLDELNVTTTDSKYSVEFVKALKDPSITTGLKITPK